MTDKPEVFHAFPTPIWRYSLPNFKELNKVLLEYIFTLQKNDPEGTKQSNRLGWHSQGFKLNDSPCQNFLKACSPCIQHSAKAMAWDLSFYELHITGMWAIINKNNASNLRHFHPNNMLSAAYYVKADKNCGNIKFHDPRPANEPILLKTTNQNQFNRIELPIEPETGKLVIFPSYLHHSVLPNDSNEERIIISFNVNLTPKAKEKTYI